MKWLGRNIGYPGPFMVLCLTEKQFLKAMKHCGINNPPDWINTRSNATTHILNNEEGESVCIVCLDKKDFKSIEITSLLVHEAVHIWQEYALRIGEDKPGPEQMAYGIQAISQELITSYKKLSKKIH